MLKFQTNEYCRIEQHRAFETAGDMVVEGKQKVFKVKQEKCESKMKQYQEVQIS